MADPTPKTPSLNLPRRWTAALVVVALAAVGGVVALRLQGHSAQCSADVLLEGSSPLLSASQMAQQPDARLDRLASAVTSMGSPFGPVRGGIGYNYDQYLHLYGVNGGVLAWTKNNAPVTLLDGRTLAPRWSLRPSSNRTAWDSSTDRFLLLDLAEKDPTRVSSYRLDDGHRRWCTNLSTSQRAGDPVGTAFLDGGDVLVALQTEVGTIRLTRLDGRSGHRLWHQDLTGAARADYVGPLGPDLAVVGGTEDFRLLEGAAASTGGPEISAIKVADGSVAWTWTAGPQRAAHVVGVAARPDGHSVLVQEGNALSTDLVALDDSGNQLWKTPLAGTNVQVTLRGEVLVTRSASGLDAYDATTGKKTWHRDVPTARTYFPYGFTLGQMPSLDADHVLLPTTTALVRLDLRNGSATPYPLPVDGVSTTYWPYQLLVTDTLLGVVTNTGAVLADRE
ncbi:MAG: hypothetical protein JWQ74_2976 [Marmoricola sp.]|nr:hypothetical protein [Marmoricola sp.]